MRWFFDINRYNDDDDSDIIGLTYKVNDIKIINWVNEKKNTPSIIATCEMYECQSVSV